MMMRTLRLQKLLSKGPRELLARGQQEWSKTLECWLGRGSGERPDSEFIASEICPEYRDSSSETIAGYVMSRIKNNSKYQLLKITSSSDAVATITRKRFGDVADQIVEKADRAHRGHFDLLGFQDLSFGSPINWSCDPLSGKVAPADHWSRIDYLNPDSVGDQKVIWELNRHQYLVTLGQAYWLTGDERYAESFVADVSSWIDFNPPKTGVNWTSSLELAFRLISWVWALSLFSKSDKVTPKFVFRLLKSITAQAEHIEAYLSYYFSPNTHLTGEALGLFYVGVALPELQRSQHWRDLGLKILMDQMPIHVKDDGVYFEQASYYHRYTTDFYLHCYLLARAGGLEVPKLLEDRLALLLDHLMWLTKPDGSSTLYGDDDGGRLLPLGPRRPNDFRDTLAIGAAVFGREDWKHVAGDAPLELLWLLGPEGLESYDSLGAKPPAALHREFLTCGYHVVRDGWSKDSAYLFFDCGPHGTANCGHAHSDALSFEFATGSSNWFIDSGTYSYVGLSESRNSYRSTAAHNTVTVDGCSQSAPAGPFSWDFIADVRGIGSIETSQSYYVAGEHHGFRRLADPVTHARTIMFRKPVDRWQSQSPYVLIQDRFEALAQHQYALHFHCAPGCLVEQEGDCVTIAGRDGQYLFLLPLKVEENGDCSPIAISIEEGWVSRCYGQRESAPRLVIACTATGPGEVVTLLVPFMSGEGGLVRERLAEDLKGLSEQGKPLPDLFRSLSGWFVNALPLSGDIGLPQGVARS
jgi:Heparinase II/III-like protein/Heparinase II/III N-terminus